MKKGWPKKSLGEICGFVRGPFGGSLKKSVFVADGFAVYEQQHAIYDQFDDIRYFIDDSQGASVYLNPCQFVSGKAVLAQTNTVLLVYFKALKTFSDAETPHEQLAALQKIIEVVPRLRELTNLFTYQLQVNNESAMDGTRAYRNGLIALSIAILLFWAVIGRQHFQTLRKKYAQQTERMHMLDVCLTNANDSIIIVSVDNEEGTVSHPITYVNHAFEKQSDCLQCTPTCGAHFSPKTPDD